MDFNSKENSELESIRIKSQIPKRCKDELEHIAETLFGQIFSQ